MEIAKLLPNSEELLNYYAPTTVDDSGEIKYIHHVPNYSKITTKLTRRNQFKSMLKTNEIVELEKYLRKHKKEDDEDEDCDVDKKYSTHQIKTTLKCTELKAELKNHGLKGTGIKADLQKRLIDHYETHDL